MKMPLSKLFMQVFNIVVSFMIFFFTMDFILKVTQVKTSNL